MTTIPLPSFVGENKRLHLGVTGSIAAYKALELLRALSKLGFQVNATLTEAATRFVTPLSFQALGAGVVFTHMFGQDEGGVYGHLQPGQTAHVFVIAPCTADALSRLANGLAHEILCAQALAFDGPLVLAPAMNPRMWSNPATAANVQLLRERGAHLVMPDSGVVACGDAGQGKLAPLDDIILAVCKALTPQDMAGKNVMVTLGPTQEPWDSVRLWTNRSTGLMGACLAQAAWLRGATVHAVAGPGVPELPAGVLRHPVRTAKDMYACAADLWSGMHYGLFSAAVADFAPQPYGEGKFKKSGFSEGFSIRLRRNPDILATLGALAGPDQRLLGFAAESEAVEERSRSKLRVKKAHLMAGNPIGDADAGFAVDTNRMFVCDCQGREEHWPLLSKADVAWRLLDWLLTL
jgi:phosphopantothenoylcysteine decarboxylase/phosphopantothenate--cysteine ligase